MNQPSNAPADRAQQRKQRAAQAALAQVRAGTILGVGTGSTVNVLIDLLAANAARLSLRGAVSSSEASSVRLRAGNRSPALRCLARVTRASSV